MATRKLTRAEQKAAKWIINEFRKGMMVYACEVVDLLGMKANYDQVRRLMAKLIEDGIAEVMEDNADGWEAGKMAYLHY